MLQLPLTSFYVAGEVYRAEESNRHVEVRDCKGDANLMDPSTIPCSVGSTVAGGGESVALFTSRASRRVPPSTLSMQRTAISPSILPLHPHPLVRLLSFSRGPSWRAPTVDTKYSHVAPTPPQPRRRTLLHLSKRSSNVMYLTGVPLNILVTGRS